MQKQNDLNSWLNGVPILSQGNGDFSSWLDGALILDNPNTINLGVILQIQVGKFPGAIGVVIRQRQSARQMIMIHI